MNHNTKKELSDLVEKAAQGDRKAMETLVASTEDMVFNLSLRMLGTFADAEDATQDIMLKVMTHLGTFRGESAVTTWVFRIAVNYLMNYKKHMFAHRPLSFEYYRDDIENGKQSHRLHPQQLDYTSAEEISQKTLLDVKSAMEDMDDLSQDFSFCRHYQSTARTKRLIQELLHSAQLNTIQNA